MEVSSGSRNTEPIWLELLITDLHHGQLKPLQAYKHRWSDADVP
jgi:hypothetical protein